MRHILAKISKELGLGSKALRVDAELYKMLLYDKGAMFKAHQDSEKAPGMFGTLASNARCHKNQRWNCMGFLGLEEEKKRGQKFDSLSRRIQVEAITCGEIWRYHTAQGI